MNNHPLPKAGLILLELILSLSILSFGLVAIINPFIASLRASKLIQNEITGQLLAQHKMEELFMKDSLPFGYTDGDFGSHYKMFRWKIDITPQDDLELKKIVLVVSWQERNKTRGLRLETMVNR